MCQYANVPIGCALIVNYSLSQLKVIRNRSNLIRHSFHRLKNGLSLPHLRLLFVRNGSEYSYAKD